MLARRHSVGGQGPSLPEWIATFLNGEYITPNISDFPACLKNGVILSSLLHKYNNELIDIKAATANPGLECLRKAFNVAETVGIPKLLDPEDIYNQTDKLSIITQMSLWKTKLSGGTFGFGKKASAPPKEKDEKIKPAAHNKSLLSAGKQPAHVEPPAKAESMSISISVPPMKLGDSSPSLISTEPSPRRMAALNSSPSLVTTPPVVKPAAESASPKVAPEAKPAAEHKPAAEIKPAAAKVEAKPAVTSASPKASPKNANLTVQSPSLSRLSTDSSPQQPSTPGSGGVAAARLRFAAGNSSSSSPDLNRTAKKPAADAKQTAEAKHAVETKPVAVPKPAAPAPVVTNVVETLKVTVEPTIVTPVPEVNVVETLRVTAEPVKVNPVSTPASTKTSAPAAAATPHTLTVEAPATIPPPATAAPAPSISAAQPNFNPFASAPPTAAPAPTDEKPNFNPFGGAASVPAPAVSPAPHKDLGHGRPLPNPTSPRVPALPATQPIAASFPVTEEAQVTLTTK